MELDDYPVDNQNPDAPYIHIVPGSANEGFRKKLAKPDSKFLKSAKSVWNAKILLWVLLTGFVIFNWVWIGVYHRVSVANYLYRYRDESGSHCDAALGAAADADDDDSTDYCLEVDHLGNTLFFLAVAIGASLSWILWTITVLDRFMWSYQSNMENRSGNPTWGYRYLMSNLSTARQAYEIYKLDVDKLYFIVFLPLNWAVWYCLGQIAGIADLAVWILIGGYAVVYAIFGVTSQVVNRIHRYRDASGKVQKFTGIEWTYLALQAITYIFVIVIIWVIGYGYALDNTHEKFYMHWGVIYASLYYLVIEIAWTFVHLKLRHKYRNGRIRSFYARWTMAIIFHLSYWIVLAATVRNYRFVV